MVGVSWSPTHWICLTDGFDMGSMALMPFVGKTDNERRAAINTIAPTGMVIRSGLSLLVARYLQLGQWYTRSHFPECIGPYYLCYLPCSYVL